jgi:hypothetical protein
MLPLCLLALTSGTASPCSAALIHDYEFNGTLADSLGGPALTSNGGTINASSYSFAPDQGPSLSGWLAGNATAGNYTIDMSFSFDTLSGYRKIHDFKNLGSDNGLYSLNGTLDFYPVATGPSATLSAGQLVRVDLTRDGTSGTVTGYVNGVQQFSFTDSSTYATFSTASPANIINFFQDDTVTGGRESSSGVVDQIRIYDSALIASDITALGDPKPLGTAVPEPASFVLTGMGGLVGLGYGWRRWREGRRRQVAA